MLLYIHGFSNLPDDVFANVESSSACATRRRPKCWIPVIWPCDNDLGIVKDYWDDQKSADYSAIPCLRPQPVSQVARRARGGGTRQLPQRINVLAHP